jgi:hypothetical protein
MKANKGWTLFLITVLFIVGACIAGEPELEPPTSPIEPKPPTSEPEPPISPIEPSLSLAGETGPIVVQGGPLSYRFATLDECERERDLMRYTADKTIVVICTDDYAIRREMKDTLDWLNYHPSAWWIYPSDYELLFLPVVEQ